MYDVCSGILRHAVSAYSHFGFFKIAEYKDIMCEIPGADKLLPFFYVKESGNERKSCGIFHNSHPSQLEIRTNVRKTEERKPIREKQTETQFKEKQYKKKRR